MISCFHEQGVSVFVCLYRDACDALGGARRMEEGRNDLHDEEVCRQALDSSLKTE